MTKACIGRIGAYVGCCPRLQPSLPFSSQSAD